MNSFENKLKETQIELRDIEKFTQKIEILDDYFRNVLRDINEEEYIFSFQNVNELKTHISGVSHSLQYIYGDLSRLDITSREEIFKQMNRIGVLFLSIARSQYENKEFFIQCAQDVRSIMKYDDLGMQALDIELQILLQLHGTRTKPK